MKDAAFLVLGRTSVTVEARMLDLRSVRQRRLLAALVLDVGRPVSADALVDAVWGHDLPNTPSSALQNQIARLRAALGDRSTRIATVPGGYTLTASPDDVDATRFERLVHAARAEEASIVRAERLGAAVALWRGTPYEELDSDRARAERTRLTELRLSAEEDGASALRAGGRIHDALVLLRAFCTREPLREVARLELAGALAASGRRAEALRELDDYRRVLATEMGISPSPAVSALVARLLDDDSDSHVTPGQPVPRVLAAVFGRGADAARVRDALASARLVTLVGPGGVGKTTLARVAAATLGELYEHGCFHIDLVAARSEDDVRDAVVRGVGISVTSSSELVDRLVVALRGRRVLLVVDNAEQVAERLVRVLPAVLARTHDVDALVTSRVPLNVPGERLVTVDPLLVDDEGDAAVELFVDRAAAVRDRWVPDVKERSAVLEICRRLDGLPLAVELAAAQLRFRSVIELARDLEESLEVLNREPVDGQRRSLRRTIDLSYDRLAPLHASVFDQLGSFHSGFVRAAVRACCADFADSGEIDAALDALVDQSLVHVATRPYGTRYALLEPIREYAKTHLVAAGEEAAAAAAHATAILELVEEADSNIASPDEAMWVAALDDERADVVAAARWLAEHDVDSALQLARAIYFYAFPRGHADLQALPAAALAAVERSGATPGPETLAPVFGVAADQALIVGDPNRAKTLIDRGFEASGTSAVSRRYCEAAAGDLALFSGATLDADAHYDRAAAGFEAAGQAVLAAWLRALTALAAAYRGSRTAGQAIAAEALAHSARLGCPSGRAVAHYVAGEAAFDDDDARRHLNDAVGMADSVGATYIAGLAHLSLATLEARTRPAASLPHYVLLLESWRRSGNWAQQWTTLRNLVVVLTELEMYEEAVTLLAGIDANTETPAWGDDADRLRLADEACRRRLDDAAWAGARTTGMHASSVDVLMHAQVAVDRALSTA